MTPRLTPDNSFHTPSTSYSQVHHPSPSHEDEWWRGKDSNLRRRKPADLQSAPVGRLGTPPRKNEPRILVSTPWSVNGFGATFAETAGPGKPRIRRAFCDPARRLAGPACPYIKVWIGGVIGTRIP